MNSHFLIYISLLSQHVLMNEKNRTVKIKTIRPFRVNAFIQYTLESVYEHLALKIHHLNQN